jgi:murein L,D-transpeptidase YcbB/YkuD
MSHKDILRKYLDMLNEDETAPKASADEMPTSDKIQIAPPKGQGSINEVITAVKNFQQASGMEPTGRLDPKTLAELLSQSGRMGQEEMEKLQAGQEQSGAEVTESAGN